jgi:tetratricopeptide (TPR) repeat protein
MSQPFKTHHPELDEMFERFRQAPKSTIFAPLADACRKAGMIEEALEICDQGVAANPEYASGHVVHGKCLYDAEKPEAAEASFRRVLELDGNNLVALKFLGIILAERGDAGAARACFEHILALDPEDRDIRRRLNEVGIDAPLRRAPEPAAPVRTVIAPVTPVSDDDHNDNDDFEGAPISLGPASATTEEIATMALADIYASQGYTGKALRIYEEVLRRQPDNADLKRKIAELEKRADETPAAVATEPAPAEARKPAPQAQPAPARPVAPPAIDETRSYEQFKRWLKSVSD